MVAVPSHPVAGSPSRLLFQSPLVQVGDFSCPTAHPKFEDSGPTDGYDFVFPRTAVWIQHEGRDAFVADSNVVPLYNAGHPYRRRQISHEGDRTDWFSVAPSLLREMLEPRDPRAADANRQLFRFDFARVTPQVFRAQRAIVLHVRAEERPDALYVEESAIGALDAVLTELYSRARFSHVTGKHRELAESARAHLNATFADQDGLEVLARSVGASVFHLCRVFRQYSGLTIHRYRSELRLRKSLELVAETGDDILTTAMALGYSSHSHFTSAFRRAFGMTPSEFRGTSAGHRTDVVAAWRSPLARGPLSIH
jgi:AraC family transcriptional regulator